MDRELGQPRELDNTLELDKPKEPGKKMKISPEGILKRFSSPHIDFELWKENLTTPHVSDALQNLTGSNGVIPGLKPLKEDTEIMGRVFTTNTASNDWGTVLKAIDMTKKGDVLVICSSDDDNAVWGELTSKTAQKKRLKGTVIYGAVRDAKAIKNLNYPVFTRKVVPNAGKPLNEGEVDVALNCGEITINPGDIIIADDCGVVVIPQEILHKVIKEALDIKKREKKIIARIEDEWSLSEILGI